MQTAKAAFKGFCNDSMENRNEPSQEIRLPTKGISYYLQALNRQLFETTHGCAWPELTQPVPRKFRPIVRYLESLGEAQQRSFKAANHSQCTRRCAYLCKHLLRRLTIHRRTITAVVDDTTSVSIFHRAGRSSNMDRREPD